MKRAHRLLLLVALTACGRSVDITVTVDKASYRAEPSPTARAVGEARPGSLIEARTSGPFGAKGFYRVKRGDQTVYLSEDEAAPAPLAGTPMVVLDDQVELFADRALAKHKGKLAFGDAASIFDKMCDTDAVALLEGGVVTGFAHRGSFVPQADAPARLGERVIAIARTGKVADARTLGLELKGNLASAPGVQGLVAALQKAASAPLGQAPPTGPMSFLRTAEPPKADAEAYVVGLKLPAFENEQLSGPPVQTLEIDQPVQVIELGDSSAHISLLPFSGDEPEPPASDDGGVEAADAGTLFVDIRGLQDDRQFSGDLLDRARALSRDGKKDEQLEMLTRAVSVPDAVPAASEALFDAAMAAGDFDRAVWGASGWRSVDLIIWESTKDAKAAARTSRAVQELSAALAPAVTLGAVVLAGSAIEGFDPGATVVALGACSRQEQVPMDVAALFTLLHHGVTRKHAQVALGAAGNRSLVCPDYRVGSESCDRVTRWKNDAQAEVNVANSTLRGLQFSYRTDSCGEDYEAEAGVLDVFLLLDKSGRLEHAVADGPHLDHATVQAAFESQPVRNTLEVDGKGLKATFVRTEEDCDEKHAWSSYREGVRATVSKGGIAVKDLASNAVAHGECNASDLPPEGD